MKTYEIIFTGRVQGVGFRYHVLSSAMFYNVKGTVQNLDSGQVKVLVQADKDEVEAFIHHIQVKKHDFIRIRQVEMREVVSDRIFSNFRIVY